MADIGVGLIGAGYIGMEFASIFNGLGVHVTVLYRGEQPVPGAIETLLALRQHGVKVAFLTNNASRHRQELAEHVSLLGFACSVEEVLRIVFVECARPASCGDEDVGVDLVYIVAYNMIHVAAGDPIFGKAIFIFSPAEYLLNQF